MFKKHKKSDMISYVKKINEETDLITIYCALYAEAQYLIQYYELKKESGSRHFQVFSNEEKQIRLVITGIGKMNAAVAVAEISTIYPPKEADLLINFGSCASGEKVPLGSIIMINKITDVESGRTFYPDMIYEHPFTECEVETLAKTCERVQGESDVAYDMEAAAFYEAGNFYYGPHQMIILKVVTDHGASLAPDRNRFAQMMQTAGALVVEFLESVRGLIKPDMMTSADLSDAEGVPYDLQIETVSTGAEKKVQSLDSCSEMSRLAEALHCSATMRAELAQLFTYWRLAGLDARSMIQEYYDRGMLPCKDKKAGRRLLNELQSKWL